MMANAQRRDLSGSKQEDKEPKRENEQAVPIGLKIHECQRQRVAKLLLFLKVAGGCC